MTKLVRRVVALLAALQWAAGPANAAPSIARQWNEAMLSAIRTDLARPTVQARNLFHFGIAIYDSWAAYDHVAKTFLLGNTIGGFHTAFTGMPVPANVQAARETTLNYAAYRLLSHRYALSPAAIPSLARFDSLFQSHGGDASFTSTDYQGGSAAALGNYLAQSILSFGLQDGSNEANNYASQFYQPLNPPLIVARPGDSTLVDPNRWQPLTVSIFIDQNGNIIPISTPAFLTPEWGAVTPFAMSPTDATLHTRGGHTYKVYDDPGPPPQLDTLNVANPSSALYRFGMELVTIWSSHLESNDTRMQDISPASLGNNLSLPETQAAIPGFYNLLEGGDTGAGRPLNPRTGLPYAPQFVPRGDYTRVLAEFWADGPTSETPPGHWFTILNYVSDQPGFEKRLGGVGPMLDDLEWDAKSYLTLGGAVHDAAVACWGIKGWYDGIRPISAIRWMSVHGQCTDPALPHYSPAGMPLVPGRIELVAPGDALAGASNENVNKIKLFVWRGPSYITTPSSDTAGVGWILGENWWPYQRPTFVTPPFGGYTSGHSTFSRAAAEVMTRLTGDEYFPGGLAQFVAHRNQFLVFEDGPSVDVTLQWATYRDASDQCSLSRIWGGIHAPMDDIPGRLIGRKIGEQAFAFANMLFSGTAAAVSGPSPCAVAPRIALYPNPVRAGRVLTVAVDEGRPVTKAELYSLAGQRIDPALAPLDRVLDGFRLGTSRLTPGVYFVRVSGREFESTRRVLVLR